MSSSSAETSLLLWALGAMVYWLGVHVMFTALRDARREPGLRLNWFTLLVAGLAIGSAVSAGMVLAMTGNTMGFALGFQAVGAGGVLAAALAAGLLGSLCLGLIARWFGKLGGALILGAMVTGVQMGWLATAGFRPGLTWRPDAIGSAAAVAVLGTCLAVFLAFSDGAHFSRTRLRWRLAGSGLMALSLMVSQELLIAGARLASQVGSVFQNQLPAPLLSLVFGAVVPLLLVVAALDLGSNRRRPRSDVPGGEENLSTFGTYPPGSSRSSSGKGRRRRQRIRSL